MAIDLLSHVEFAGAGNPKTLHIFTPDKKTWLGGDFSYFNRTDLKNNFHIEYLQAVPRRRGNGTALLMACVLEVRTFGIKSFTSRLVSSEGMSLC